MNSRLSSVQVVASAENKGNAGIVQSDGSFSIQGLPSGTYTLRAFPLDAVTDYAPISGVSVTVSAPSTTPVGNIVLPYGSKIKGTVKALAGNTALPNISVVAVDSAGNSVRGANTNGRGEYVMSGLIPGSYRIRFNPPQDFYPYGTPDNAFVPEYYDDQLAPSAATTFNVLSTPVTITNINATLAVGGRLSGKVTDAYGIAIPSARVSIYDASNTFVQQVYSSADGTYLTQTGLPSGQYKIRYDYVTCNGVPYATVFYKDVVGTQRARQPLGSGASLADATLVTVVAGQTTIGVNGTLVTGGGRVTGRVTNSGTGVAGFKLSLNNGDEAATDPSGYFTFTAVYTGSLTLAPSAGMSATTPASRNVVVPTNASGQDFQIGTPPALSTIIGQVTRNGAGVAGFILNVSNGTQVPTDANGNFTIVGLPAGTYTLTPAPGQAVASPVSRTVTVPPDGANADFVIGARVSMPVVQR